MRNFNLKIIIQSFFASEITKPIISDYNPPLKDKKHNVFNPALKHVNKHRYVKVRKLNRQYR